MRRRGAPLLLGLWLGAGCLLLCLVIATALRLVVKPQAA